MRGGGGVRKWRFGDGEGVKAPPYDHMADYPGSTWHLPISVRTNITRFECPIRIGYTNSQLRGVPLKPYDAFWVDLLAHSFEQSFFLHQKHAWWDVTLFLQAACHMLHHIACWMKWQVNHQITPISGPCQPPKRWWLLCHLLCCYDDYESQEVIITQRWHYSRPYKNSHPTQNQGTCAYTLGKKVGLLLASKRG